MKKKIFFATIAALLMTTFSPFVVSADNCSVPVYSNDTKESEISPRSDDIRYQYKKINGIPYKRLYNYTTHKALSSWTKI